MVTVTTEMLNVNVKNCIQSLIFLGRKLIFNPRSQRRR